MKIDPALRVSEIARRHPEAMRVFARHKIDLCCGGALPLKTVAKKHKLDLAALLRELENEIAAKTP
jgi:regulator of cell morphogenesis and NO signaling